MLFSELMLSFRTGHEIQKLETVSHGVLAGAVLPLMFSAIVRLGMAEEAGRARMLLPFMIAFSCDAGAYFTGMAIGGRKLTPRLSPHKTVAGSVGGLVSATVVAVAYGLVLRSAGLDVRIFLMAVYGLAGSVACQMGDLTFSAVKRLCGFQGLRADPAGTRGDAGPVRQYVLPGASAGDADAGGAGDCSVRT